MKVSLLFAGLLLFAASAQAQHACHHSATPASENSQGYALNGFGGGIEGGSIGTPGGGLQYEPPRDFKIAYFTNDGPYVPSTYLNYEDALALGRQELAAGQELPKGNSTPSLGEIARAYRNRKAQSLQLEAHAMQDDSGKPELCTLNGKTCRRL
ncbi:MAG: hypothetical protein WA857_17160 [Candidatus Acidiferrum sp.]